MLWYWVFIKRGNVNEKGFSYLQRKMYEQVKAVKKHDGTLVIGKEDIVYWWKENLYIGELLQNDWHIPWNFSVTEKAIRVMKKEVEPAAR